MKMHKRLAIQIFIGLLAVAIPGHGHAKYVQDEFTGKSQNVATLWLTPSDNQESVKWIIANEKGSKEISNNLIYSFMNNGNSDRRFDSIHNYLPKVELLLLLDCKVMNIPIAKVTYVSDTTSSAFRAATVYGVTAGGTDYYRTQVVKYTLNPTLEQLKEITEASSIKGSLRETFEDSEIGDFHKLIFDGKKVLKKFLSEINPAG
jgi:hypothetical protein